MVHETSHEAPASAEKVFKPHATLDETAKAAIVGGAAGLFLASVRNALSKRNIGALSVLTRGGPIIGISSAAPAAYVFFSRTTMNLREQDDHWSAAIGGLAMGAVLGMPTRRMPVVMGLGAGVGIIQGFFYFLGGRIDSFRKEDDTFERKETIRRTTRLPVAQTVAELGEGRGIRPPGYEERRAERLQEKYGVEINPVSASVVGSQ